ncbi:hypothetical protein A0H81_03001 [Grifola frondosa]|uniref:Uncharacterized protein n=1 Tax=Grifola frondosa TaxID=5627 RepID=A0A1C7MH24_GRIFR|nr:hypothetical protein A0H81_03001 [Grifola frondosa]
MLLSLNIIHESITSSTMEVSTPQTSPARISPPPILRFQHHLHRPSPVSRPACATADLFASKIPRSITAVMSPPFVLNAPFIGTAGQDCRRSSSRHVCVLCARPRERASREGKRRAPRDRAQQWGCCAGRDGLRRLYEAEAGVSGDSDAISACGAISV